MTNGLNIYGEIFAHFLIFQEALPHIGLCNCSTLNFLIYEEHLIFDFISAAGRAQPKRRRYWLERKLSRRLQDDALQAGPFLYWFPVFVFTSTPRDIQRVPMTSFSLVFLQEYFDCPQRDSHAVHYIYQYSTLQPCYCDVLHRRLCADSDKIPEGRTSTYISHLLPFPSSAKSSHVATLYAGDVRWMPSPAQMEVPSAIFLRSLPNQNSLQRLSTLPFQFTLWQKHRRPILVLHQHKLVIEVLCRI